MADDKSEDKFKGQMPMCLTHFKGVKENLVKVFSARLKKFAECGKKWAKLHCEQANIANNSYNKFDDSLLINSDLSKHDESCDEEKICQQQKKEDNLNARHTVSQMEVEVIEPVEPLRKSTRILGMQRSKAMPQRNKHVLPECCIICGRYLSWYTKDKVRLNPDFVVLMEILYIFNKLYNIYR